MQLNFEKEMNFRIFMEYYQARKRPPAEARPIKELRSKEHRPKGPRRLRDGYFDGVTDTPTSRFTGWEVRLNYSAHDLE